MITSSPAEQPEAPPPKPSILPNLLSASRMVAAPIVAGLVLWADAIALTQGLSMAATLFWIAAAVFVLAALTDIADGRLARDLCAVTPLGAALDHASDKALVTASLVSLAYAVLPLNLVVAALVILTRDVAMAGLREGFMASGRAVPVSAAGKLKTVLQMVAITAALVLQALAFSGVDVELVAFVSGLMQAGLWAAAALALYSAGEYLHAALKPNHQNSAPFS